jgi:3-hydroxymyristoyl/3-hydroxydecanoyl-(acyl carrier protein) dehydratase
LSFLERALAPDHPAAQGHFPGNPIIPGAVLLAETLRMIESHLGVRLSPCHIRSAKFPHPARPGERLRVELSGSAARGIRFTCAVEGTTVLSGEVRCATPAPV